MNAKQLEAWIINISGLLDDWAKNQEVSADHRQKVFAHVYPWDATLYTGVKEPCPPGFVLVLLEAEWGSYYDANETGIGWNIMIHALSFVTEWNDFTKLFFVESGTIDPEMSPEEFCQLPHEVDGTYYFPVIERYIRAAIAGSETY